MDFFKKFPKLGKQNFEKEEKKRAKKQKEVEEKVLDLLTKGKIDEIRTFIPLLKKEDESVILGIEDGINKALVNEPALHENLKSLFIFLFNSDSPTLFQLFYDSLLFNVALYQFLIQAFESESENHFDFLILTKAEDFDDKETKAYVLGVLAYLKESFLKRMELDSQNEK